MAKLKEDFEASGGRFEEWRIGDLFILQSNPQLDKDNFVFSVNAKYPYFTRTVFNNGIFGQVEFFDNEHLVKGNGIAVGMMGMQFFYMRSDFYAGQFTKTAYPRFENFNEKIALYFISLLNKFQQKYLGVLVRNFEETFYNTIVKLPVYNHLPALDYMEHYISLLEEEKMLQVDKFLEKSGLSDTTLTAEETAALERFRKGDVKFEERKIGELFDIHPTKSYKMTNPDLFKNKGNIPVVTNSSVENGITGYVDLDPTENGGIVTYSDTTTDEGIFYQPYDFVGYSHVQGVYPLMPQNWNEKKLLFFVSLFKKSAKGRFDYASKFNRAIAKEMLVCFPMTERNEIDYDFMQHFISAQEKIAIRGVVKYKAEILNANGKSLDFAVAAEPISNYGQKI